MSAIGQLWFKWVSDPTKPHTIDMVPSFWRKEVEELVAEQEANEAIDEDDGGAVGDYRETNPVN